MFGLYDNTGVLRYTCIDKEACVAYAELFDLDSIDLMPLPEPNNLVKVKYRKKKLRRGVYNS